MRLIFVLCCAAMFASACADAAAAQSGYCKALRSQYMAALSGQDAQSAAGSAVALRQRLSDAQAAADRNNCSRGLLFGLFGGRRSPQCPRIMIEIDGLRQALRGANFDGRGEVESLQRALSQNGCGTPRSATSGYSTSGYRTLCVRTCDGYYFPISRSVGRGRLATDAQVCQSMYAAPGQARLFTMRTDGDVADAMSDGIRYADQPYAFQYRSTFDAGCASQLRTGLAALADRYDAAVEALARTADSTIAVPLPQHPPSRFEDTETIADARGKLDVSSMAHTDTTAVPASTRVVGAAYYNAMLDEATSLVPRTTNTSSD